MRATLITLGLLVFWSISIAGDRQRAGCRTNIVVQITDVCRVDDAEVSCAAVGERLVSMHASPRCELDIPVNRATSYESVYAALKSLNDAGFVNIGFVSPDAVEK
jgi:biopolymer transport protein ExbD